MPHWNSTGTAILLKSDMSYAHPSAQPTQGNTCNSKFKNVYQCQFINLCKPVKKPPLQFISNI